MTVGRCAMVRRCVSPALVRIGFFSAPMHRCLNQVLARRRGTAARSAHQRSSTSTAERARDTQQQITVLLARSALLRQWSR